MVLFLGRVQEEVTAVVQDDLAAVVQKLNYCIIRVAHCPVKWRDTRVARASHDEDRLRVTGKTLGVVWEGIKATNSANDRHVAIENVMTRSLLNKPDHQLLLGARNHRNPHIFLNQLLRKGKGHLAQTPPALARGPPPFRPHRAHRCRRAVL
eukprot:scaffold128560_cov63-Phaeocystis_antarctica.AAC.2